MMDLLERQAAALQAASWDNRKCLAHQRMPAVVPLEQTRGYTGKFMDPGEAMLERKERCAGFESEFSPTWPRSKAILAYARHRCNQHPGTTMHDAIQQAQLARVVDTPRGVAHPMVEGTTWWRQHDSLQGQRNHAYVAGSQGLLILGGVQNFEMARTLWGKNSSHKRLLREAELKQRQKQTDDRNTRAARREGVKLKGARRNVRGDGCEQGGVPQLEVIKA